MNTRLLLFIIPLFSGIYSCTSSVKLKPVGDSHMLNDGNSKVWMIDRVIVDQVNFAPPEKMQKDVLVFYKNGKCLFQPLKTLGHFVGKKGEYALYPEEKGLSMYFVNEKWNFNMEFLKGDTVKLTPKKDSDLKYTFYLIPFPEF